MYLYIWAGVYTGFSSLTIAQALQPDGIVHAFDISEEFTDIGKPIWKEVRTMVTSLEILISHCDAEMYIFCQYVINDDVVHASKLTIT